MHNEVEIGAETFTDTTRVVGADAALLYTMTLDLTANGIGEYSGRMSYEYQNGRQIAWNYSLTRSGGLVMQSRASTALLSFNNGSVSTAVAAAGFTAAGAPDPERMLAVEAMDRGGSFTGLYTGGALVGTYTSANGNTFAVEVTPGTATVDGEAIDVANADH